MILTQSDQFSYLKRELSCLLVHTHTFELLNNNSHHLIFSSKKGVVLIWGEREIKKEDKMSDQRGKRKREVVRSGSEEEGKKLKRGKKEQISLGDDVVVSEEEDVDVVVIKDDDEIEQRERRRSEDVFGKREQQNEEEGEEEGDGEREEEVMKRRRKEEEEKKKRFECGICLELMSWEKEPRLLPCCGLSFCSLCLNKLFLLQNPSSSSSSSSPSSSSSSSSSPSLKGVKCSVCREMNECGSVETLSMNYLIPETIDVLLSSNLISFSNQSSFFLHFLNFLSFFPLFLKKNYFKLLKNIFFEQEMDQNVRISKRVENKLKCIVPNATCLFVILVIHLTLLLFSLRNHKRCERDGVEGGGRRRRLEEEGVVGVMGLENLKKRECSKHPSETISGYCFQCSSFVCTRCILGTHDDHRKKVKSIEESILEKRNEVVRIGDRLDRRLIVIEKKRKQIEEEMKELEEKLEKKRIEKKEIELEKEDLRIRKDSIIRLSNTPTTTTDSDLSLFFDDQLFSTLLQTANDIVFEAGLLKPKKGVICCDGGGASFRFVSSFPLKSGPYGVSMNSDGNIFICEDDGLRVRDKEGNEMIESPIQKAIDSLQLEPVDVSIGLNDQIVVLDHPQGSYRVVILNKEGELIKSFGSYGSEDGQFDDPYGVDVDEEGRIIVLDTANYRIQVFENDGSFLRSFGSFGSSDGQFHGPNNVVVDGDGNIVICDTWNDRIQVMDIEGNFIRCFGTSGSGDSQLSYPRGVDVDGEGRIVVCVSGNGRVSVFEKDGTFLFSFGQHHMKDPYGVVVDSFGTIIVSDWKKKSIDFWK